MGAEEEAVHPPGVSEEVREAARAGEEAQGAEAPPAAGEATTCEDL